MSWFDFCWVCWFDLCVACFAGLSGVGMNCLFWWLCCDLNLLLVFLRCLFKLRVCCLGMIVFVVCLWP